METPSQRQAILDELANALHGVHGPASALNRQKHSKVFEACAALKLELRLWSHISVAVLKPKHPHHGRGGYRDLGVDCAAPDLSHCAQAKWYAPGAYIKFSDASTFYTYAHAILGAATLTIVHSEGVRISPAVLDIPGIDFLTISDGEIDAYADEARKLGDPARALKQKSPGGPAKNTEAPSAPGEGGPPDGKEAVDDFVVIDAPAPPGPKTPTAAPRARPPATPPTKTAAAPPTKTAAKPRGAEKPPRRGSAPKPPSAPSAPGSPRRTVGSLFWAFIEAVTGAKKAGK